LGRGSELSQFEYVTAFVSILLALAIAEMLAGLGRLIRERDHVRVYWVHIAWMLLAILVTTQYWWTIWRVRAHEFANFFEFLSIIFPQFIFFLVAFLLSPPVSSDKPFDLREYYFHQVRWLAPLFAVCMRGIVLSRSVLGVEKPLTLINGVRIVVAGVVATMGLTVNPRVHEGAVLVVSGLLFAAIVILFLQRV
jgi:hypothetical protein